MTVLGFEALGNVREKYRYLKILFARLPPWKRRLYRPSKKAALRRQLRTSYRIDNDEQRSYQAIVDQLSAIDGIIFVRTILQVAN